MELILICLLIIGTVCDARSVQFFKLAVPLVICIYPTAECEHSEGPDHW